MLKNYLHIFFFIFKLKHSQAQIQIKAKGKLSKNKRIQRENRLFIGRVKVYHCMCVYYSQFYDYRNSITIWVDLGLTRKYCTRETKVEHSKLWLKSNRACFLSFQFPNPSLQLPNGVILYTKGSFSAVGFIVGYFSY